MTNAFAVLVVAASIVLSTLAAVRSRDVLAQVPLMLDFWIAAGLLRLTESTSWRKLAAAAALVAIRKLVGHGLLHRPRAEARRAATSHMATT